MKIPLSLIKKYLAFDLSLETICEKLTLLGIEVDAIINEHPPFAKVIVGEIISVKEHPEAKKLKIAQVHNGKELVQVVCGAPNCRPKIKSAFAIVGSILMGNDGKNQTIEKATLRGVDSHGMLCSSEELNLWKDVSGIIELPLEWENGSDLCSLLWDPILEISLTPNLGHCFSAIGIARELGASIQKTINLPSFKKRSIDETKIKIHIEDFSLTPRYMGCLVENVKIGPSPFWLQKELRFLGMKPINNVVDVTNYILMKTGQPMHAFDFDKIDGKTLKIGPATSKEKWLGLDGVWREVPKGALMISDAKKTVAAAGVLGGQNTSVQEDTRNIFLEAAFFDPIIIRKSAKELGIRTDSAIRFEKGIDPNGIQLALDEALSLIEALSGGKASERIIDLKKRDFPRKKISFRPHRANALLGTRLSHSEIIAIFERLECKITSDKDLIVEPPSYRFDLNEEIDLIEEIARLYGYNNIERAITRSISSQIPNDPVYLFEKNLRKRCISLGLQEFLTSDLISPKLADLTPPKGMRILKAIHAKTEEYSVLRPSLMPGLLQVAKTNSDLKNHTFSGFEIGRIHFLQQMKCIEIPMLSILIGGKDAPNHFDKKPQESDFFTLKGIIEDLFVSLRIDNISFKQAYHESFHPGRQADICIDDLVLGSFGEIHPEMLIKCDIKQRVLFAEMDIDHLMRFSKAHATFSSIPNLPSSERDWTVPLPPNFSIGKVFEAIKTHQPNFLESFELIDFYEKKNATFRFIYRDPMKTISHDEVEKSHGKLISQVLSEISC